MGRPAAHGMKGSAGQGGTRPGKGIIGGQETINRGMKLLEL
jgi:hypothetical protein